MQHAIAWVHIVVGLMALVAGLVVFAGVKGSRRHRQTGYVYVVSMVLLNVTAFLIYRLYGRFGPFHIAAIASLATVIAGMVPAVRRQPVDQWLSQHYAYMSWSYVGLLAATVAEIAVRVPALRPRSNTAFFAIVLGATALVTIVGAWLINRLERRVVTAAAQASPGVPATPREGDNS